MHHANPESEPPEIINQLHTAFIEKLRTAQHQQGPILHYIESEAIRRSLLMKWSIVICLQLGFCITLVSESAGGRTKMAKSPPDLQQLTPLLGTM